MGLYTKESKERVRDAADMLELVAAKSELRRAGANSYMGLCPFHDERTPSLSVDPVEKLYYCFGCQASGDVFSFVQATEGVDFKEALEILAERFNVELEREQEDPEAAARQRRRERLLELLARTAAYYERYMWDAQESARARAYLESRGLGEPILREFHVGYAPSAWDRVLTASRRGGFSEQELYAAGIAQRSQKSGRPYDRFRERIMFPLADLRGRVLGFGARAMRDNQQPKYLNTADGEIYHKGRHLFGAHLARADAARAGSVIVCEGYTDVIAMRQAGLRHTVGLMGTALTEVQLAELGRLAPTIVLALDADSSGQEAMLRAARLAAGRRLQLRVVPLPTSSDPAELLQRDGADAMRELVERSVVFARFHVERILADGDLRSAEGKDQALERLRPVLGALGQSALREELTRGIADRLELSATLVESLLRGGELGGGRNGGEARETERTAGEGDAQARRVVALDSREQTERAFLARCIALPQRGREALERVRLEDHFTSELTRRAAAHLGDHLDAPIESLPEDDAELAALLRELAVRAASEPAHEEMLAVETLQLELARVDRAIQAARGAGEGTVTELASKRAKLQVDVDRALDRAARGSASASD